MQKIRHNWGFSTIAIILYYDIIIGYGRLEDPLSRLRADNRSVAQCRISATSAVKGLKLFGPHNVGISKN